VVTLAVAVACCAASGGDEVRVKREGPFAFARKPAVTRAGDRVTITFETKAFCDVAVAIEESSVKVPGTQGFQRPSGSASSATTGTGTSAARRSQSPFPRIVRHVASGVLGPNAPAPFQKGAKRQVVVWDGKDDLGRYIDDKDKLTVRVSLGLEPRFERSLFWSPYKRFGATAPLIQAAPEGVYVYDARTVNHLRLFDHDGVYVRTVHPPPADTLAQMKGIDWKVSPQTGEKVPVLRGFVQNRFLTSGEGAFNEDTTHHGDAMYSATAMRVYTGGGEAAAARPIALAFIRLNRLSTDGSTGGLPLEGPMTGYLNVRTNHFFHKKAVAGPSSLAFSPDGRTLYLAGYMWPTGGHMGRSDGILHGVRRMAYAGDAEPKDFLGSMATNGEGTADGQFTGATSVAVDGAGRIYVSDYLNDRVQVFSPAGKHLRNLPVTRPAKVILNQRTGEVLVLSWYLPAIGDRLLKKVGLTLPDLKAIKPTVTSLGTFDAPRRGEPQPLPPLDAVPEYYYSGQPYEVDLDPWAKEPTLWVAERRTTVSDSAVRHIDKYAWEVDRTDWGAGGVQLYAKRGDRWVLKRDFNALVRRRLHRLRPPSHGGQRLTVDPTTGLLYVLEYRGHLGMKSNPELLRIDPNTGRVRPIRIPMSAEEVCFDLSGDVYARDARMVMRYDPTNWREIPWDYGQRRKDVGMAERTSAVGGLALPGRMPSIGHQMGMFVSSRMRIAVSCYSVEERIKPTYGKGYQPGEGYRPYTPTIYPGRVRWQEVHVFDQTGKVLYKDAIPGLAHLSGLGVDEDDFLYVLAAGNRVVDGGSPFNPWSGTLIKIRPGRARIVASNQKTGPRSAPPVALAPADFPKRPPDLQNAVYKTAWVDGAEWFFGGVGYSGFSCWGTNRGNRGYLWDDWHSRFAFDGYNRSFAHELDNFSIAVVDKNGNLMMRFGRYGNADDGVPLVRGTVPFVRTGDRHLATARSQSPVRRSIGGSEVALMRPTTLATHSDRRLFIADLGNARIVSVKLDYHVSERVALRDVRDGG